MSRNTRVTERIRPFLKAMERSIEDARNRRTGRSHPGRLAIVPSEEQHLSENPPPTRLKARPKRRF